MYLHLHFHPHHCALWYRSSSMLQCTSHLWLRGASAGAAAALLCRAVRCTAQQQGTSFQGDSLYASSALRRKGHSGALLGYDGGRHARVHGQLLRHGDLR